MKFYSHFSLAMDRSPGFGSALANYIALFRLAFAPAPVLLNLNLAGWRNSPVRSTKSTRSRFYRAPSACKHRVSGSLSLPSRGPFHLSLTVLCAIGHQVVFSLGGWSPLLPAGFPVSCGTLGAACPFRFSLTGLLPSSAGLSIPLPLSFRVLSAAPQPPRACPRVWALSCSLAATGEIDFSFSSSGYLDVSVPRVPPIGTMDSSRRDGPSVRRVSTFGCLRIYACLRLPVAFRSLPRPSSALGAWASTLCSSSLDHPETNSIWRIPPPATGLPELSCLLQVSRLPLCGCQGARRARPASQGFRSLGNDTVRSAAGSSVLGLPSLFSRG